MPTTRRENKDGKQRLKFPATKNSAKCCHHLVDALQGAGYSLPAQQADSARTSARWPCLTRRGSVFIAHSALSLTRRPPLCRKWSRLQQFAQPLLSAVRCRRWAAKPCIARHFPFRVARLWQAFLWSALGYLPRAFSIASAIEYAARAV